MVWHHVVGAYEVDAVPKDPPKTGLNEATKAFGDRMRERRNQLGISQEAAAERTSMHWSAYSRLERGQRSMRLETILKIAEGLEIDPGDLMRGLKSSGNPEDN